MQQGRAQHVGACKRFRRRARASAPGTACPHLRLLLVEVLDQHVCHGARQVRVSQQKVHLAVGCRRETR